ncbi:MAG: hypothetical protein IT577_15160 [Verrucomicrobiae bacterium]|nr:hypothetical protein [Verrucomicrobiae bacterium]
MRRAYAILMVALFTGCSSGNAPDMGPVGGGLSVIGLGIVVAAFITAVASAMRGGDDREGGEGDA